MNRRRMTLADLVRGVPLAECRDCHEPIRFVELDTGSFLPVNPNPVPAGHEHGNVCVRVLRGIRGAKLHGYVVSAAHPRDPQMLRFVPHAAMCEERERPEPPPPLATLFD